MKNFRAGIIGMIVIAVMLAAVDFSGISQVESSKADKVTGEAVTRWLASNHDKIYTTIQAVLFGHGIWVRGVGAKNYALKSVGSEKDAAGTRVTVVTLDHEKLAGEIEMVVDLHESKVAGIVPSVKSVKLLTLTPAGKEVIEANEIVYTNKALLRGRVNYYLTAISAMVWTMMMAGILFGLVRRLGLGLRPASLVSILVSATVVVALAKFDIAYLSGIAASVILFMVWRTIYTAKMLETDLPERGSAEA